MATQGSRSLRPLRELAPPLLLAALAGALTSWLFVSRATRAQALEGCTRWEVATFLPNVDDTQLELLPLGIPKALAPQFAFPFPPSESDAAFLLPEGWEPIAFGAAAGQTGEAVVLARRCRG